MTTPESAAFDSLPPAHQWLPLLSESLARQGRFRWQLYSSSMEPTLPSGCQIEIVELPLVIPLGALLVFVHRGELVVHRLVHRRGEFFITQGDNRNETDRRLRRTQILGIVVAAYDDKGRIWPSRAEWATSRRWLLRARWLWLRRRLKRYLSP